MSRQSPASEGSDRGPMIGTLLRMCHEAVNAHLVDSMQQAGLVMVQPRVTQPLWDHPEGLRLTELAAMASMTKQSMGELVDQMLDAGYVERVDDPSDGRAKRLQLTRHGRRVGRRVRALVREVEEVWAEHLGEAAFRAFKASLTRLQTLDTAASLQARRKRVPGRTKRI